jgi:ABC-type sulfate transport system substrate-binding protein
MSIEAEPSVSVVDNMWNKDGMSDVSKAYFDYLHTGKVQAIAARHYYRARSEDIAARYRMQLPHLDLFTVDEVFGGWKEAENRHFARGGVFDQLKDK